MIVVFLGPPGSGKGTQAKRFVQSKGLPQISTGDMLRAAIQNKTQLGLEAKKFMDQGQLVPDAVVIGLISDRTAASDCSKGFILDGFPRTIAQAEALDLMLGSSGKKVERAVEFQIADQVLVARLSGRRTCLKCGAMYHVVSGPAKKDGICDQCGGQVVQRDDDREDVIKNRLKVYHQQTSPLINYFQKQGKLSVVNADQAPDLVTSQVDQLLR